jgi:hypothetical protein
MPRPFLSISPRRPATAASLRALGRSALSHAGRRPPCSLLAALALGGLAFLPGCGGSSGASSGGASRDQAQRQLDELVAAVTPISATDTSDKQDAWFHHQVDVVEQARHGSQQLGEAALARFEAGTDTLPDIRAALLDVAAHCAPETAVPALEKLIRTYDGELGLGLRTRAVDFLADVAPQRAIAMYEPLLRDPQPHQTRPSQEAFVIGWTAAAHKLKITDARVLCDVTVDLKQPPDARYSAITALGTFGGPRAIKALQEVLVEASSDGLMRRKATQSLLLVMPKADFCALVTRMSQNESDPNFIDFLADMLERNCGQ